MKKQPHLHSSFPRTPSMELTFFLFFFHSFFFLSFVLFFFLSIYLSFYLSFFCSFFLSIFLLFFLSIYLSFFLSLLINSVSPVHLLIRIARSPQSLCLRCLPQIRALNNIHALPTVRAQGSKKLGEGIDD